MSRQTEDESSSCLSDDELKYLVALRAFLSEIRPQREAYWDARESAIQATYESTNAGRQGISLVVRRLSELQQAMSEAYSRVPMPPTERIRQLEALVVDLHNTIVESALSFVDLSSLFYRTQLYKVSNEIFDTEEAWFNYWNEVADNPSLPVATRCHSVL